MTKIAVVICTIGRPAVLHDTVCSIQRQRLKPMQILVVSTGEEHVLRETLAIPGVSFVLSSPGTSMQRNRGLDSVDPSAELVAFLDDDMELCDFYFSGMSRLFSERPDVVIASGTLLHDGGRSTDISRESAKRLCREEEEKGVAPNALSTVPLDWAYGCNMIVRWCVAAEVRFDERLPLYGWLEDSDYGFRCTVGRHGPVTSLEAKGVHIGWRGGRVSGVRFGFSQIVNPFYLWRKARVFPLKHIIVEYWMRCFAGNLIGTFTGDKKWDRRGGLKGNLLGMKHLLSGNCDPGEAARLR